MLIHPRALLPALLAAAVLTACGGTPTVDADAVEKEISTKLEEQVGTAPDGVSCPDDLVGEEGETLRCTLIAGTDELGVTVTVTAVDGEDVRYEFAVDEEAR